MPINADWHRDHPMPVNATEAERITWHLAHVVACGCRPVPEKLAERMRARGIATPEPRAGKGRSNGGSGW